MHKNKLVAVMNGKVEVGVVMNALAHMCIGFGADIGRDSLRLTDYVDSNGGSHPSISEMPFIILKAKNSNKLNALKKEALVQGVQCVNFLDTMTGGSFEEQIERTKQTEDKDLSYYCFIW